MVDLAYDIVETTADSVETVRISGGPRCQLVNGCAEVGETSVVASVCRRSRRGVDELVDTLCQTPYAITEPCFDDGAVRQLLDDLFEPAGVFAALELGQSPR